MTDKTPKLHVIVRPWKRGGEIGVVEPLALNGRSIVDDPLVKQSLCALAERILLALGREEGIDTAADIEFTITPSEDIWATIDLTGRGKT